MPAKKVGKSIHFEVAVFDPGRVDTVIAPPCSSPVPDA
jgi:hypothetical protein